MTNQATPRGHHPGPRRGDGKEDEAKASASEFPWTPVAPEKVTSNENTVEIPSNQVGAKAVPQEILTWVKTLEEAFEAMPDVSRIVLRLSKEEFQNPSQGTIEGLQEVVRMENKFHDLCVDFNRLQSVSFTFTALGERVRAMGVLKDEIEASFSLFKGTLYRRCGEFDLAEKYLLELTGNIKFASKRNIQLSKLYLERCDFTKASEIANQGAESAASVDSKQSWLGRANEIRELKRVWDASQFRKEFDNATANSNLLMLRAASFLKNFETLTGGSPKAIVYTEWEASLLSNDSFLSGIFGATTTMDSLPPQNFKQALEMNSFEDPSMVASFLEARVLSVSKSKKLLATIGLGNGPVIDDEALEALDAFTGQNKAISSLIDLYKSRYDNERQPTNQQYKKLLNRDVSLSPDKHKLLAESFCLSQLSPYAKRKYVASKWRLACFEGNDGVMAFLGFLCQSEDIELDYELLKKLEVFEALRCSCDDIVHAHSVQSHGQAMIFLDKVDALLQERQRIPSKKVEACLLTMQARVLTAQAERNGDGKAWNKAKVCLLKALNKRSNFVNALLAGGHLYTVQCISGNNANRDPVESCMQAVKLYQAAFAAICDQKKNKTGILDTMLQEIEKLFNFIEWHQKSADPQFYVDLSAAAVGCGYGSSKNDCTKSFRDFKFFLSPECQKFQKKVCENTKEQRGILFKQLNNICTVQNGEERLF